MHESPSRYRLTRQLDLSRIFAAGLVMLAHVALLLSLQFVMRPTVDTESPVGMETVLTVEFIAPDPVTPDVARPATSREQARPSTNPHSPFRPAPPEQATSVYFVDEFPAVATPPANAWPRSDARDVFDPPASHKPFPSAPLLSSNLPNPVIRLPDRPSMMRAYWAVPEGENLQGRLARTVPVVGLLLAATGAIGGPHCPPKSEHPDCLQRLLDDQSP